MASSLIVLLCVVLLQSIQSGLCEVSDFSPTGSRLTLPADEEQATLEPIHGTPNFRLNLKKGKDDRPWINGRDSRHIHCVRPAKCEKLKNQTCFGSKLPYATTSLDLTDSDSQDMSRERLLAYEALRNVPKCWAVVQPFLCAVFVPKCEKISNRDMVFLPSLELCRITQEPCRLLYDTPFFPEFLKCNETFFPSKCNNNVREMKFNMTGQCMPPLVNTDSASSYYKDIEGCGVQCRDPLYTDDEHRQIHNLIFWLAMICLLCSMMVIATFLIDWKNANKYPAVIVFHINCCYLVNCLAWLAQFVPGNREDIVCRKDGTLRHSEPSADENLSCILVFVCVYYSQIAAMVWFVILLYCWCLETIGVQRIDKKSSYFHLIAWSVPLVLTIATMALSEVDGNSTTGVCFVGYQNYPIRAGFLLGPLVAVLLVGSLFVGTGMKKLFKLKSFTDGINSTSASKKLHEITLQMGIRFFIVVTFVLLVISCQLYEFQNSSQWTESLRRFIICKITSSYSDVHQTCKLESRPSLKLLMVQLICFFLSGIVMSSWCLTSQSGAAWKRYWKKKFGWTNDDESTKSQKQKQKYKIIAQTYAKRKEFQDTGRLSVSFYEPHTDPAGLNFDIHNLNSADTNEMSSTWCNYLPKIARRRSAIVNSTNSSGAPRKSSVDSEYSYSMRQVSVESRRNSMDSQVSVKFAEVQAKVECRSSHVNRTGRRTGNGRHTSKRFHQHRRGSSTSVESQIIRGFAGHGSAKDKRMRRRSANAGLVNADDINSFISQFPKLAQNFQGMTTTSDDDNGSRTSLKIQDSRLDVVVRKNGGGRFSNGHQGDSDVDETEIHTDHRKYTQLSQETILNDVRRMYPGLTDMMAIRSATTAAEYSSNTLNRSQNRDGEGRASKNSQKSGRSGGRKVPGRTNSTKKKRKSTKSRGTSSKSQREVTTQVVALVNNDRTHAMGSDDDSSFTSYSSEFALPIGGHAVTGNGIQSSYSGMSVGKHSRSSKNSCDVGTQANAYEIATQTRSYGDSNDGGLSKAMVAVKKTSPRAIMAVELPSSDDERDRYTESHQLMGAAFVSAPTPSSVSTASIMMSATKKREMTMHGRRGGTEGMMSESEKLRMLLLPS